MITNGSEEASTHSPSLIGAGAAKRGGQESPYPFVEPSTPYERNWWDTMRQLARAGGPTTRAVVGSALKTWGPLLRLMTPAQRQEFHEQRQTAAAGFVWDLDSARGDGERHEAGEALLRHWQGRLAGGTP